jgi:hypothetical protein
VPGSFSALAQRYGHSDAGEAGGGADSLSSGNSKSWGGLLKSVTKTAATLGKKGLKAAQVTWLGGAAWWGWVGGGACCSFGGASNAQLAQHHTCAHTPGIPCACACRRRLAWHSWRRP